MSPIIIKRSWTPRVRYAARRYRRDLRRAQRTFERAVSKGTHEGQAMSDLCADEARAVLDLLKRLGYGSDRPKAPARDRLELELMVHEQDESASLNFFRLFMAQQKGRPLDSMFSRRGRKETMEKVQALRQQHLEELRVALETRRAAHAWLSQYFGRFELRKKYSEFTRVQFDKALPAEAKAAYMALLFEQVARRSGRTTDDVLEEYNTMVRSLGLDLPHAKIDMGDGGEDGDGDSTEAVEKDG